LLHGEPGNGKTAFAEALAGELGIPLVELTYGCISSKWLGEMPRLMANCFGYAKQIAPCVLFVDEIDTFIRSRDSMTHSEDLKVTNTMLTEIVSLRNHQVVLVAATNYLALLDAAAIREGRFDFKVEVTAPDAEARIGLLQDGAKRYLPGIAVDPEALRSIANRWSGFSVSRLLAVAKALPVYATEHALHRVGFDDWMAALRLVQGRKGQAPSSAKRLGDLILEDETRDALTLIAHRLRNPEKVEAMGGTLPGGILFYGPSGTGKTVAAQALALESGWAFLSVGGPDLIAERQRVNKLYREASDLRPALVFIDEADDVLRERRMSGTPDVVNRLLALMDGTSARVADVIFVAATNHPEQIDPALLRAGRFTEKVAFYPPAAHELPRAIEAWLNTRNVKLDAAIEPGELASLLAGCTIADLEGVLQYAVNRAIARGRDSKRIQICNEDIGAALRVVRT
jgi:transitional endoplasmic reticulum ATPase